MVGSDLAWPSPKQPFTPYSSQSVNFLRTLQPVRASMLIYAKSI